MTAPQIETQSEIERESQTESESQIETQQTRNLAVARRFMENGIAKANLSVFDETLDQNITVRTGLSPQKPIAGLMAYKQVFADFSDAFPVKEFVIHEIFGTADKVIVRFTATAVFKKDYYGVAATNQIVPMEEVHILTFRDGKVISNIVSGTNFPFEYLMYPVLKDVVIGNLEREDVAADS